MLQDRSVYDFTCLILIIGGHLCPFALLIIKHSQRAL